MRNIKLPDEVLFILNKLDANDYEAYVVGGCVRDSLLGIKPHDWDICTSALPEQIVEVFSEYKVLLTGLQHGTVTIVIDTKPFEITTYRIDGEYKDNRHPSKVEFISDLKLDLMRRDFTINAMAYNYKHGLIDYFHGLNDLDNRIIRCVGNPTERFKEDALRMIRAIRFAVRYNCNIDTVTLKALFDNKDLIKNISFERISSEITKILDYPNNLDSVLLLEYLIDLLKPIIPDMYTLDLNSVCERLVKSNLILKLRLAILFDFSNIESVMKRLRFSNSIIQDTLSIRNIGYDIYREISVTDENDYKYYARKLLNRDKYDNLIYAIQYSLLLAMYNDRRLIPMIELLRSKFNESYAKADVYNISRLDINGSDLLELGYSGRQIGYILNTLLDMVMQDKIPNIKDKLIENIYQIEQEQNVKL